VGLITNKMRGKKYHTASGTVPESDNKIKEEAKLTPTHMTATFLAWYRRSIKKHRGKTSFKGPNLTS
jgi:hypothetical protein